MCIQTCFRDIFCIVRTRSHKDLQTVYIVELILKEKLQPEIFDTTYFGIP